MFDPLFDPKTRRLHIRYSGFWTVEDARSVVSLFRAALRQAAKTGPFSLLDDLRGWPTQTLAVVNICMELAPIVRTTPVTRNAMVIEEALLRMQVNRTLNNLPNCRVFANFASADEWLSEVEA